MYTRKVSVFMGSLPLAAGHGSAGPHPGNEGFECQIYHNPKPECKGTYFHTEGEWGLDNLDLVARNSMQCGQGVDPNDPDNLGNADSAFGEGWSSGCSSDLETDANVSQFQIDNAADCWVDWTISVLDENPKKGLSNPCCLDGTCGSDSSFPERSDSAAVDDFCRVKSICGNNVMASQHVACCPNRATTYGEFNNEKTLCGCPASGRCENPTNLCFNKTMSIGAAGRGFRPFTRNQTEAQFWGTGIYKLLKPGPLHYNSFFNTAEMEIKAPHAYHANHRGVTSWRACLRSDQFLADGVTPDPAFNASQLNWNESWDKVYGQDNRDDPDCVDFEFVHSDYHIDGFDKNGRRTVRWNRGGEWDYHKNDKIKLPIGIKDGCWVLFWKWEGDEGGLWVNAHDIEICINRVCGQICGPILGDQQPSFPTPPVTPPETCDVTNCDDCSTDSTKCDQCKDNFYYNSGANTCTACHASCVGACEDDSGECSNCATVTFKNGAECTPCGANCDVCTNNSSCDQCKSGFHGSDCQACIPNCSQCSDGATCDVCKPNFFGPDCVQCIANCDVCTNGTTCDVCNDKFWGSTCTPCDSSCLNSECDSDGVCVSCPTNFYHGNTSECKECSCDYNCDPASGECIDVDTDPVCSASPQVDYDREIFSVFASGAASLCDQGRNGLADFRTICKDCDPTTDCGTDDNRLFSFQNGAELVIKAPLHVSGSGSVEALLQLPFATTASGPNCKANSDAMQRLLSTNATNTFDFEFKLSGFNANFRRLQPVHLLQWPDEMTPLVSIAFGGATQPSGGPSCTGIYVKALGASVNDSGHGYEIAQDVWYGVSLDFSGSDHSDVRFTVSRQGQSNLWSFYRRNYVSDKKMPAEGPKLGVFSRGHSTEGDVSGSSGHIHFRNIGLNIVEGNPDL